MGTDVLKPSEEHNQEPESLQPLVDIGKALRLRLQGHTFRSIADRMGVSHQAVQQRLSRYTRLTQDPNATIAYKDNEAELLDAARAKLLTSIVDKADHEKSSVNNLAYAWRNLFDGGRMLRNQSTSNIHMLSEVVERANKRNNPHDMVSATSDDISTNGISDKKQ